MGANLHQPTSCNQLLALAVFVDSLKTAYIRSIHVHEEKVGSLYTVQQDFLLNPGGYTSLSQPVMSGSFRTFMSSAGVKQIMGAIVKMHENDGWHCVLAYRSDSPTETTLPYLLTPSRNLELKNIPSLEQDLKLVEYAIISSRQNAHMYIDDESMSKNRSSGEGKGIHKENCGWFSSNVLLSCPSDETLSDHSNDHIPGLETPERTPRGQQLDIWHNWGSELELASPRVSNHRTSHSYQATLNSSSPMSCQNAAYPGTHWNPCTLLDLNLDLTELPSSQDNNGDCALSNPVSEPMSCLNLELGTPALSLQQSTVTEDSMDCFTLECFGDSPSSYDNTAEDPHTKPTKVNATQNMKSVCSEDSVDCHGSVINMSSSEVNGNSSMTSTGMYSNPYQRKFGCMHGNLTKAKGNLSMASNDMYSPAYKKNAGCINECMMNVSSSAEMKGTSCMISGDMYSAPYYKKKAGCTLGSVINALMLDLNEKSSSGMYSGANKTNSVCINGEQMFKHSPATSTDHSWRGEGRENSRRTCSSGSRQSMQQHSSNGVTDNKPRIIRPGSTSERIIDVSLQDLTQYFCMPITQAAKELKVGLTVLKKRCREFGIPRWPHRKIKSVHSLINNIQDLAEDQGVKCSPRVQNVVKELEEQKKLMVKMPGVELAERTKKLRQACFKANYKKRRLGMMIGDVPCNSPFATLLPSSTHSLDMMDLNPTLIIPSPRTHHTMDQFL